MTPDDTLDFSPHRTRKLEGHDDNVARFAAACQSGRLHHAWILSGGRGIGKASFAYLAARALLQTDRAAIGDFAAAQDNKTSKLIEQNAHPDLFCLSRNYDEKKKALRRDISIDDVRAAIQFTQHTSALGGRRVCIIDSIEDCNAASTNALLKILEEPPANVVFFIICHQHGALLDTIASRCLRLDFAPLAAPQLAAIIARLLPDTPEAERAAAAYLTCRAEGGSVDYALKLLAGGGFDLYQQMLEWLKNLPAGDVEQAHALAARFSLKQGAEAFDLFAAIFSQWLYELTRQMATRTVAKELFAGEADVRAKLCATGRLEDWLALWEKVTQSARRAPRLNLERKQIVLDWLAMTAQLAAGRGLAVA